MKAMKAGKLRKRLIIKRATIAADSLNDQIPTPATLATVWGEIMPTSGREFWLSDQARAESSHVVTMRWPGSLVTNGLLARDQLVYGTRVFEVVQASNTEERNRMLYAACKEVTTT